MDHFDQAAQKDTLDVVDLRTCNVLVAHPDCTAVASISLPGFQALKDLDPVTHTLYVATQGVNTVSVVDGNTCNAEVHTGCDGALVSIALADVPWGVTFDRSTRTVYVDVFGNEFAGFDVDVIDARHCNAADTSACVIATALRTGRRGPLNSEVDPTTHTLYVLNNAGGDEQATVSVIDTRLCNGHVTSPCATSVVATVDVTRAPFMTAFDRRTHRLFTSGVLHAAVSAIDGRRCNASTTSGCRSHDTDVTDLPGALIVDPDTHTLLVSGRGTDELSLVSLRSRD